MRKDDEKGGVRSQDGFVICVGRIQFCEPRFISNATREHFTHAFVLLGCDRRQTSSPQRLSLTHKQHSENKHSFLFHLDSNEQLHVSFVTRAEFRALVHVSDE